MEKLENIYKIKSGDIIRMEKKFEQKLINLFQKNKKYLDEEGNPHKSVIKSLALKLDEDLIELLITEDFTREVFFKKIKEVYVFNVNDFIYFISDKNFLSNSYSKYKNKIGLSIGNSMLNEINDVVLNFPFKDCVLEGGQTKDDQIRNEIFYNEILAPDEIDRLLDEKVLTNFKRYDKKGESDVNKIKRNLKGDIEENLIIKGNNLLALHTLKSNFSGKVKLIYIDPPYNTGGDSFGYNDRFNHSTWLTFMKNRLEVARELLRDDGSIFIQIDDFEDAYLKVLMDEIFGSENFRNKITWKRRGGSANPSNRLNNVTDYILWYSKTPNFSYSPIFSKDDENTQKYIKERFNNVDEKGRKFMKSPLQSPNPRPNLMYEYKGYKIPKNGWSISKEIMEKWDKEGKLWFPKNKEQNINRKIYLDEYEGQPISSLWTDISVINPMSKERNEFEGGQKPEELISRIISMVTEEGDLILDFFVGSGTTAAVAHKMKRQYIGIEQLDYIEPIPLKRIIDVVKGLDVAGISKKFNWQGGGSFIYCELKKWNEEAKNKILSCKSLKELKSLFDELYNKYFLNYNLKIREFKEKTLLEKDFEDMSLKDQQRFFCDMLDLNQMYVNYSEIEDKKYGISKEEIHLNKQFYGGNN